MFLIKLLAYYGDIDESETPKVGPPPGPSFEDELNGLKNSEYSCFCSLKQKWEEEYPDSPFEDGMYLRFARWSPGGNAYDSRNAWKIMERYDRRYLTLTAESLKAQLMTKVCWNGFLER